MTAHFTNAESRYWPVMRSKPAIAGVLFLSFDALRGIVEALEGVNVGHELLDRHTFLSGVAAQILAIPWVWPTVVGIALLVWAAWPLQKRSLMAGDKTPPVSNVSGKGDVTSYNQSGGVTAGTYVNQAPEPICIVNGPEVSILADGTLSATFRLEVPHLAENIQVVVTSPALLPNPNDPSSVLNISGNRTGLLMLGHSGTRDGFAFSNIPHALGSYTVIVRTNGDGAPKLTCEIT